MASDRSRDTRLVRITPPRRPRSAAEGLLARALAAPLAVALGLALGLAVAGVIGGGLAGCTTQPVDPTANVPIMPSETRTAAEKAPAAIAPRQAEPPLDERAPHTATRIAISELTRVERTAGQPTLIDVRIDAVDGTGADALLGGDLRIVLKAAKADPCYLAFDVPLGTKRQAERRVDATLGQGVLRLRPEWEREPARGDELELSATLTTVDGGVLEAAGRIVW